MRHLAGIELPIIPKTPPPRSEAELDKLLEQWQRVANPLASDPPERLLSASMVSALAAALSAPSAGNMSVASPRAEIYQLRLDSLLDAVTEGNTARWAVQQVILQYYRGAKRRIPFRRLIANYRVATPTTRYRLYLAEAGQPMLGLHPRDLDSLLAGKQALIVEVHPDDQWLRAAVLLRRVLPLTRADWGTMTCDPHGVRDADAKSQAEKAQLRAHESRAGATLLGVSETRWFHAGFEWPLLHGIYERGRLASYQSEFLPPTIGHVDKMFSFLQARPPEVVVLQFPIDHHPQHSFSGWVMLTALACAIEQGALSPDTRLLFTGGFESFADSTPMPIVSFHDEREELWKEEGFTQVYRTQDARRPGAYQREMRIRDAAVANNARTLYPEAIGSARFGQTLQYAEVANLAYLRPIGTP